MFTVQETAKILGVSVHMVYILISSEELTAKKVNPRKIVIKTEDIERYNNNKRNANS